VSAKTTRAFDAAAVRAATPALGQAVDGKKLIYLDSACTALKPACVAERLSDFYLHWGGCGGKRSSHLASQKVEEWFGQARQEAARFISAESPNEIVFTSGTTEAMNLVARSFPYEGVRREVVLTDLEHNAAFLPFYEAAARGELSLKFCPSRHGKLDLDALTDLVTEKTALVVVTRASNVFGGVQPVSEIAKIAHRKGAKILVDEAQYLSSHREDVVAADIDFAAFSGHKLGGPFGVGVLYGKENLLNRLGRAKVGGGTVKSVRWTGEMPEVVYLDAPMRFEAGVQNFGGALGLSEALRFRAKLPQEALRAHVSGLVKRAAEAIGKVPHVKVLGDLPSLLEGSLVSFYPVHDDFSVADFNLFLNHELGDKFIAVRCGEHCAHLLHQKLKIPATIRVSFYAYNTASEVDAFVDALRGYAEAALS
jgi:cysteine desulfurase / selenocysteine lyase